MNYQELAQKPIAELTAEERAFVIREAENIERKEKEAQRAEYERIRNEAVNGIGAKMRNLRDQVEKAKEDIIRMLTDVYELLKLHSNRTGDDDQGNFTLVNEDASLKVVYRNKKLMYYDERSNEAEKYIKDFLASEIDNEDIRKLVLTCLERTNSQLDPSLVQKLTGMRDRFDNPDWHKGLDLLQESYTVLDTKLYISVYEKSDLGEWLHISTDFAKA